jgi:CRP-like cAMP-binding protein
MMTQYKIRVQGSADKFNRLQKFLAQEEIDQGLAMAIKLQVKVRLAEKAQVRQQDVEYLNLAPKSLQESLWHFRCMKRMSEHVLWNAMNRFDSGSIHAVCYRSIVETKFDKEDTLFDDGAPGDSMYFISAGKLKYRPGELAAEAALPDVHPRLSVKPGSWCSEPALWTDWSHVGTMEAVSTCETLQITCSRLMQALDRMPEMLEIASDYCRAFHRYLEDAVRLSDLPDVVDYHELMLGLGITSRLKLADPLIQKLRSRTFFSQRAVDLLQAEVADGKCNMAYVGSEMLRTVFVVALRIQRAPHDQRVLVKVGEVLRENSEVVPYCILPGIKRCGQRCSKEVVDQLLETELLELSGQVEVNYMVPPEQVPIIQTSDQYHVRTRYLRTTFSAFLLGEEADKGLAWTPIANLRTIGPRRSKESASFGPRRSKESASAEVRHRAAEILNRQEKVLVLRCRGENRAACKLYFWLAQQEFEELSQDYAKPVLKQWAGDLDCSELC